MQFTEELKSAQTNPENRKVASNTEKMSENEMKKINKHLQWHPSSMWGGANFYMVLFIF